VSECEGVVYADSSTGGGVPPLTPRPIRQATAQLRDMLKSLEQNILDIVKDIDSKKKVPVDCYDLCCAYLLLPIIALFRHTRAFMFYNSIVVNNFEAVYIQLKFEKKGEAIFVGNIVSNNI